MIVRILAVAWVLASGAAAGEAVFFLRKREPGFAVCAVALAAYGCLNAAFYLSAWNLR